MSMTNTEKAKKLYESCNIDAELNTLIPMSYFHHKRGGAYQAMALGHLINQYSRDVFENDWIPLSKDTFFVGKQNEDDWKSMKKGIYKLEKKKMVETTMKESQNYIRISTDTFYDQEIYNRD